MAVVTGAGKTLFAMQCMLAALEQHTECHFLIVVPTVALLDQWHVGVVDELGASEDDIALIGGGAHFAGTRRIVIAVMDSAREVISSIVHDGDWFLIVDECHHAGSDSNRRVLQGSFVATLGLSATPERQYDTWFEDYVVPALGPVVYRYAYEEARRDGVIADFALWNVRVPLLPAEQERIDSISASISRETARLRRRDISESPRLRRLLFARSRASQSARSRVATAVSLVDSHRGQRGIVFHEAIEGANRIAELLSSRGHRVRLYHSGLGAPTRYLNLRLYSIGQIDVLVTCRALDEGIDVPATEYGILAASTASHRQRVQRMGRVLRPAPGKAHAVVMTLYALPVEASSLQREEVRLEGVAEVRWFEASRP